MNKTTKDREKIVIAMMTSYTWAVWLQHKKKQQKRKEEKRNNDKKENRKNTVLQVFTTSPYPTWNEALKEINTDSSMIRSFIGGFFF